MRAGNGADSDAARLLATISEAERRMDHETGAPSGQAAPENRHQSLHVVGTDDRSGRKAGVDSWRPRDDLVEATLVFEFPPTRRVGPDCAFVSIYSWQLSS